MTNPFMSVENKKLLWDIMRDTDVFASTIVSSSKQKVIDTFESQISHTAATNPSDTFPLTELNKRFLANILKALKEMEHTPTSLSESSTTDMQLRATQFEERLKRKQGEFYKSDIPPAPKISFADKEDTPLDIESELHKIQATRSNDTDKVTFTTNKNWDFSSVKPSDDSTVAPHLTIDHASNVQSQADMVLNKKVSWTDDKPDSRIATFMTKLKDKKTDVDSHLLSQIKSDLQEIKQIQQQILDAITIKSTDEFVPSSLTI